MKSYLNMMRTIIKIETFCFLIFSLGAGCVEISNRDIAGELSDDLIGCDTVLRGYKYFSREVPIMTISPAFNIYLDSIIRLEEKCPFFSKCTSGFVFSIKNIEDCLELIILSQNIYTYDYKRCYGIFYYKKYRFICIGGYDDRILTNIKKCKLIKYSPASLRGSGDILDDRFTAWTLSYCANTITIEKNYPCYPLSR